MNVTLLWTETLKSRFIIKKLPDLWLWPLLVLAGVDHPRLDLHSPLHCLWHSLEVTKRHLFSFNNVDVCRHILPRGVVGKYFNRKSDLISDSHFGAQPVVMSAALKNYGTSYLHIFISFYCLSAKPKLFRQDCEVNSLIKGQKYLERQNSFTHFCFRSFSLNDLRTCYAFETNPNFTNSNPLQIAKSIWQESNFLYSTLCSQTHLLKSVCDFHFQYYKTS